jgi:hypothetical protein
MQDLAGPRTARFGTTPKAHGFAIVSKDSDFADRSVLESDWGTAPRPTSKGCCVRKLRQFEGS